MERRIAEKAKSEIIIGSIEVEAQTDEAQTDEAQSDEELPKLNCVPKPQL